MKAATSSRVVLPLRYPRMLVDDVLDRLIERLPRDGGALRVGLSGLQGSGKTTLAGQLARAATLRAVPAVALSLDDFYLTRRARRQLADAVHPELATRGPPGTHDIDLLETTLEALETRSGWQPVRVPRFDKGRDDRTPRSRWPRVMRPPRLIVLEGWFVGVRAQPARALLEPVNAWERRRDPDGSLRRLANRALRERYAFVWRRLDVLIALLAPSFAVARQWRRDAEAQLRARESARQAMDAKVLERFLPRFERISRHALASLPALADIGLALDEAHQVRAIIERTEAPVTPQRD